MVLDPELAIVIGRLPSGQSGRRDAVLVTLPASSFAWSSRFILTISGRSAGAGTLSNHSDQVPEPGSCATHSPEKSGRTDCPCACPAALPTSSMSPPESRSRAAFVIVTLRLPIRRCRSGFRWIPPVPSWRGARLRPGDVAKDFSAVGQDDIEERPALRSIPERVPDEGHAVARLENGARPTLDPHDIRRRAFDVPLPRDSRIYTRAGFHIENDV